MAELYGLQSLTDLSSGLLEKNFIDPWLRRVLGALPGAMEHVMQIKPEHSQQRTCNKHCGILRSVPLHLIV